MQVRVLEMENFRGIKAGRVVFRRHTLLVGGNNIGKSTVCEALELVLGPERVFRRPVVDEHDFTNGTYLDHEGNPVEIRVRVILTDLSEEQERRFGPHLRRWDVNALKFVDTEPGGIEDADAVGVVWALRVIFIGRYDRDEDDFVGGTFFEDPELVLDELDEEVRAQLGQSRSDFTRAHKRVCGFIYLRALRTGSRALSLQRGSLLDTILQLGGEGATEMWSAALASLEGLEPAVGDIEQLKKIRVDLRAQLAKFVNLAPGDDAASFFVSDLTRAHLRETVRLFVATQPSDHLVPYTRQGTGSINLLVFALLTIIAKLKEDGSVIFVMEEPEIALPPHTQRRVTKYVVQQMGQSIVTSHSPYVIEQFEPTDVVILSRSAVGLAGTPISKSDVKTRTYKSQRKQFAEAILSRAVLVLEGATEIAVMHAASEVLDRVSTGYSHIDLAGISLFDAGNDRAVPKFAPIFNALGKPVYGMRDKLNAPDAEDAEENIKSFVRMWDSPEKGIEDLLVAQIPVRILRRFLEEVAKRDDYPSHAPYSAEMTDAELPDLACKVLKAHKGDNRGYAGILIMQCETEDDLPEFIRDVLTTIDADLGNESEFPMPAEDDVTLEREAVDEGPPALEATGDI